MGLKPMFNQATFAAALLKFANENEDKFIQSLAFIGEEFANKAKAKLANGSKEKPAPGGGFWDRTGNLRSSIGYGIYKNGKNVLREIEVVKNGAEGAAEAKSLMDINGADTDGIVLIVTAGMEYARYVEANKYDVITGSRPSKSSVVGFLKDVING